MITGAYSESGLWPVHIDGRGLGLGTCWPDKWADYLARRYFSCVHRGFETGFLRQELLYTGGIPQRSDTDVHSAATAKTGTALWQQWQWQCWDNDVHISVTAMATDSAATVVSVVTTSTVVCTSLSQRCQLTLLSQHCQCHRCHSAVSCQVTAVTHSVHSNVTVLSLSSLLHRCQFTTLTY